VLTRFGFSPMTLPAIEKLKDIKGVVVEDLPEEL
jgi:hypothetical protein